MSINSLSAFLQQPDVLEVAESAVSKPLLVLTMSEMMTPWGRLTDPTRLSLGGQQRPSSPPLRADRPRKICILLWAWNFVFAIALGWICICSLLLHWIGVSICGLRLLAGVVKESNTCLIGGTNSQRVEGKFKGHWHKGLEEISKIFLRHCHCHCHCHCCSTLQDLAGGAIETVFTGVICTMRVLRYYVLCIMYNLCNPIWCPWKNIVALKNWLKLWIETWRNFGVKQDHLRMKIAPDIGKHLGLQIFLDHRSLSSIDSNIETCCNFITHNQPLTTHNQHRTTYNHP